MTQRSYRHISIAILICALAFAGNAQHLTTPAPVKPISWNEILKQEAAWYGDVEAIRIADNVLLYQRSTGGWPKNIDMATAIGESQVANVVRQIQKTDSTIDNGA